MIDLTTKFPKIIFIKKFYRFEKVEAEVSGTCRYELTKIMAPSDTEVPEDFSLRLLSMLSSDNSIRMELSFLYLRDTGYTVSRIDQLMINDIIYITIYFKSREIFFHEFNRTLHPNVDPYTFTPTYMKTIRTRGGNASEFLIKYLGTLTMHHYPNISVVQYIFDVEFDKAPNDVDDINAYSFILYLFRLLREASENISKPPCIRSVDLYISTDFDGERSLYQDEKPSYIVEIIEYISMFKEITFETLNYRHPVIRETNQDNTLADPGSLIAFDCYVMSILGSSITIPIHMSYSNPYRGLVEVRPTYRTLIYNETDYEKYEKDLWKDFKQVRYALHTTTKDGLRFYKKKRWQFGNDINIEYLAVGKWHIPGYKNAEDYIKKYCSNHKDFHSYTWVILTQDKVDNEITFVAVGIDKEVAKHNFKSLRLDENGYTPFSTHFLADRTITRFSNPSIMIRETE